MNIRENYPLQQHNTFHINCNARFYAEINSEEDFLELINQPVYKKNQHLVLGGGSNVLFTKDQNALVIKNNLIGKTLINEDENHFNVKIAAGEVWHEAVLWCIENNYAGLENLSLIPGKVGASPMQNIGAYGVEIKDVFESLEALDMQDGAKRKFNLAECEFGYRESVFKRKLKNRYLITSVSFKLNKKPNFNTSYGAIEKELQNMGVKELSIKAVSDAVINIRSSKLPDPNKLGNAGSFFKNPEVSATHVKELKSKFPGIVTYELENGNYKVAAGWLIEKCGWKGKRIADAGVHVNQALVLVNYGNSKGDEILNLSSEIIKSVKDIFNIELEREVNIY
jgi:UDP-N-acetylmuramate dehydrogenase